MAGSKTPIRMGKTTGHVSMPSKHSWPHDERVLAGTLGMLGCSTKMILRGGSR
jgi:hypothetical protein